MRRVSTLTLTTLLTTSITLLVAPPADAAITTTATALDIAQSIFTDPTLVTGASFVAKPPSGTPDATANTALAGFPTHGTDYGILTTGDANLADDANCCTNSGVSDGGGNVRGTTDYDVTILKIDFNVPYSGNCVSVGKFRFLSEEFSEYVGSTYNDAFIMEMDVSTWTTAGSAITAPDNFAFDNNGDPISVNSSGPTAMSTAAASGTTYDGATDLLTAKTPVTGGAHSLYISIFDQGDNIYDSAAFVDGIEIQTVAPAQCQKGAVVSQDRAICDAVPVAIVASAANLGPFTVTAGEAQASTPEVAGAAIPAPASLSSPPASPDLHVDGPIAPVSYSDANVDIFVGAAHGSCDVSAHRTTPTERSSQAYGRAGLEDVTVRLLGPGITLRANTIDFEQNGHSADDVSVSFLEGCHLVQLVVSPPTPSPASTLDSCTPQNTALSALATVYVTFNEVGTPYYDPTDKNWVSYGSAVHIRVVEPGTPATLDVYLGLVIVGVTGVPATVPAAPTYVVPGPCAVCIG